MKVLFLTKYGPLGASSRYRSYQYLPFLVTTGLSYDISPLFSDRYLTRRYSSGRPLLRYVLGGLIRRLMTTFKFGRYDLIVIEKELFPYLPAILENWLLKKARAYTLDFDDALFHIYDQHPVRFVQNLLAGKFARLIKDAVLVTVGNSYIAEYAKNYSKYVELLPTVINVSKYPISPEPDGILTIGWIGTPNTARYLHLIAKPLKRFFEQQKGRLLLIGVNKDFVIDGVPIAILPWNEKEEISFLQKIHVGIMPLPDLPFERGKSGLKLLQYLACNRPVIASPVGVNKEIINQEIGYWANSDEEWLTYLLKLAGDPALRQRMGNKGRLMIEERYNLALWSQKYTYMLKRGTKKNEKIPSGVTS